MNLPTPLAITILFIVTLTLLPLLVAFMHTLATGDLRPERLRDRYAEARDNLLFTVKQKAYASGRLLRLLGAWMTTLLVTAYIVIWYTAGLLVSPLWFLAVLTVSSVVDGTKTGRGFLNRGVAGGMDRAIASLHD